MAEGQRIPSSVAVFGKLTIPVAQDGWSPKSGDGKGVDHFCSADGDRLISIVMTVSQS